MKGNEIEKLKDMMQQIINENVRETDELFQEKIIIPESFTKQELQFFQKCSEEAFCQNIVFVRPLDEFKSAYKSIIVTDKGIKYLSKDTTNIIMKKIFKLNRLTYEENCKLIQGMAPHYKYKLPYVCHGKMYIQEQGHSKKSTSWYGIHSLIRYDYSHYQNVILTLNHVQISTKLSRESFQTQLNRVSYIRANYKAIQHYINQFIEGTDKKKYISEIIEQRTNLNLKKINLKNITDVLEQMVNNMNDMNLNQIEC